jgi:hypothetical protein
MSRAVYFFSNIAYEGTMPNDGARPDRSWQEIASDAAKEKNPERLIELTNELERALDERKKSLRPTTEQTLTPARTA